MDISNVIAVGTEALQSSSGNIGVNLASGDNILQQNTATIASLGLTSVGGSSDAEVFSLQNSTNNIFGVSEADLTVVNRVEFLGNVLESASGNVGVNVATGAFTVQNNSLALASAIGTANLAEATAAVVQQASFGRTFYNNATNQVILGNAVLANATGNIGLNLAAGTNIVQQNTLVISAAQ